MLASADLELIKTKSSPSAVTDRYLVFLQNLGGEDVYIELYKDATSANSAKVTATTGEISLGSIDLKDINILAGANTSEIRVLVTK